MSGKRKYVILRTKPVEPPMTKDHAGLVERLRSSAKAFRENPVYSQDGDGTYLTAQADECEQAADLIESMMSAGPIPDHAALQARFRTMLSGPFINLHIRRDIEMAVKVLESIPAMLEQARAEGREEARRKIASLRLVPGLSKSDARFNEAIGYAEREVRSLSATRKGSDDA